MLKKYGMLILAGALLAALIVIKVQEDARPRREEVAASAPAAQSEAPAPRLDAGYFETFRAEREAVREREMQYLDEIIATASIGDETLEQAVEQKLALVENMEAEFTMESMILAKGFEDVAVTFHNGAVNVVMDAQTLSDAEVAQILDIVQRETAARAGNIKIITGEEARQ